MAEVHANVNSIKVCDIFSKMSRTLAVERNTCSTLIPNS